jgi:hypothetical protein
MTANMTGVQLIAAERKRQIKEEGWTAEHDTQHPRGALAKAAICYAAPDRVFELMEDNFGYDFRDPWPWDQRWDKRERDKQTDELIPHKNLTLDQRIRNLVKAGALIAAEIDKLQAER